MQAVADYIIRFIPFIPPLSAVAVDVVVNTYLFPLNIQGRQRDFAVIRQFSGIDSMELVVAKKPGLEEIVQNINQNVYLLNKGDGASKFAEPGMIDHIFLVQRETDKNPVLLSIQTKIFFRAEFSITDLWVLYRFTRLHCSR